MTREQIIKNLEYLIQLLPGKSIYAGETLTCAIAALRQGWVRTAERVPEGDEHKEILGLYKGKDYYLYDIVQIGWLRLHPEMYPYWTDLPAKPE